MSWPCGVHLACACNHPMAACAGAVAHDLAMSHALPHAHATTPWRHAQVRLLMISLLSRLIGAHRLMLQGFYPYVMRYMQPHQREVTAVLASAVQAAHELVPPENLSQVIGTLVTHFVSDRSRPEVRRLLDWLIVDACNG